MHHLQRRVLPFTSIVGQDEMKFALILNAVNPRIGGVLIRGDKGTAKSTAVRALADLLEDISVVEGCPFNCHPGNPEEMCDLCYEKSQNNQIKTSRRKTPVVDLPLGATEDRVVGSLDVERAIKEGIKALEPGILAACNRGILYIDEINLLDDHVADVLLDSAAMGVNIVEREGVSVAHPSRFILVGTMNPEEGEIRPQLLDRFGLQVEVGGIEDVEQRMEIVHRAEQFEADPEGFSSTAQEEQDRLLQQIAEAKLRLPTVELSDHLLRMVASTCVDMGVKTHRAEIVISRAAKTIAALEGRDEVSKEDIRRAMMLALPHRMRNRPFEPPTMSRERLEKSMSQHQPQEKHDGEDEKSKGEREEKKEEGKDKGNSEQSGEENIARSENSAEGHPSPGSEEVFHIGGPIDVRLIHMPEHRDKKLRRLRSGRRINTLTLHSSGRYLRHRFPLTGRDIAVDATIRAAAPFQHVRREMLDGQALPNGGRFNAVLVKTQDIREKERVRTISSVVLFVVDASGSMGAAGRMESAKGAVLSMLMDAYQRRDRIGMLAFREDRAELLLPPSSSVDLAQSRLRQLPTGGKTPLSAGLDRGVQLLKSEVRKNPDTRPMLVLISDGRANVSQSGNIRKELLDLSLQARQAGIYTIVIDTEVVERAFMDLRLGYCREISQAAGGKYYSLDSLSPEVLSGIVLGEQEQFLERYA